MAFTVRAQLSSTSWSRDMKVSLPLQEVTSIQQYALNDGAHCFRVVGAGVKLCLRVDGERADEECKQWVDALENRVKFWRRKAEYEGPRTAVPLFGREAQREGSCWQVSRVRKQCNW